VGEELYMLASDLTLRFDPELMSIVQEFAIDAAAFVDELSRSWPKLLTADLYAGPTAKFCF
jgi:catalase (peroxidase I)